MGRTFNGTTAVITLGGGTVTWDGSTTATTIMAILIRGADNVFQAIWGSYVAPNWRWGFEITDSAAPANILAATTGNTTSWRGPSLTVSDGWVCIGGSFPLGTEGATTPTFHKYVYSTNTWTHPAGTTNSTAGTGGAGTTSRIGQWESSDFYNGTIEVIGVWNRALASAEAELLAYSLANWHALAPNALWVLNQDPVTVPVRDLTGNGANQTAITSTSVSTTNTPVFNLGLGPMPVWRGVTAAPAAGRPQQSVRAVPRFPLAVSGSFY